MLIYPDERLAVFIDGANLYATARALEIEIDYKALRAHFAEQSRLVRTFYYTAILEDQEYSPLRPLIDWLDYNGFTLVTKPVKEFTDEHGRRKIKGNMDIEIAVDMLNIAENVDHIVLFSGDGDFRRLLEAVQRRGVRVTVVSSNSTQPSMIADELRRQADQFIDIVDLAPIIGRKGPRRQHHAHYDEREETTREFEDAED
ncbi:NYN domain-containing protein [Gimibacter soli]|uniref:NYN domain-containing protein n=1 Tax=Gimibacter soli TaxID=3024400 RepID=A0AAE9XSW0_9PROT|nr:NYN domain-containing protein [Gimibacter soli]WCL55736.1 NYN domain-containing protein [Gimibacter soli]